MEEESVVHFSPLQLALLAAQLLAEQLAQALQTVQQAVAPPPPRLKGQRPLTTQLAHATDTVQYLATWLEHAREREGVQLVTTQLAQVTITAQLCSAPDEKTREGLRRLEEQLEQTQATLQLVTAQIEHDLG
jgi:hypothetical protein